MGVLKGFERRLEGAVEGMFARMFKSGLQPIELAQAVQRYAVDHRHVTSDGVVVCNDYRISINSSDADRLSGYGASLPRELATVVRETARDKGWSVPGDVRIRTVVDPDVLVGRLKVVGRVSTVVGDAAPSRPTSRASSAPAPGVGAPVEPRRDAAAPGQPPRSSGEPPGQSPSPAAPPAADGPDPTPGATQAMPPPGVGGARRHVTQTPAPDLRLEVVDTGQQLDLVAGRYVIGRLATCDLPIDSTTVSREHAALVKRNDTWWVFDLGSTNGTKVNGIRASEQPIRPGDRLDVGTIELTAGRG